MWNKASSESIVPDCEVSSVTDPHSDDWKRLVQFRPTRRNRPSVILAAHGSRQEPNANDLVREHAERLETRFGLAPTGVCFHQGSPGFSEILDLLSPDSATVIPFFLSDGYYSKDVLPKELSKNRRFKEIPVEITPPVGVHPEIPILVKDRIQELIRLFQLPPEETTVLVVGHGTRRNSTSRDSTEQLVEYLERSRVCSTFYSAFLDDTPGLEEQLSHVQTSTGIVLPFLIGQSAHVLHDIPAKMAIKGTSPTSLPGCFQTEKGRVVLDRALGQDPRLTTLLAQLAVRGMASTGERNRERHLG